MTSSVIKLLIALALAGACAFAARSSQAANYDFKSKPGPATCVGVLKQTKDGTLFLDGIGENEDDDCKHSTAITFLRAVPAYGMLGPSTAPFVLRGCALGQVCEIKGLLKGVGYDSFYWSRIDAARPIVLDDGSRG